MKTFFEFLKQLGFALFYQVGDIICRYISGKNEFPKYYWITIGLILIYQIMRHLIEIKNKIEENK